MSSVVIQTSFLGDMVLTTPLLERLATRGPVDVVATPANAPLLANHPAVRDVIVFDKRGNDRGLAGMRRMAHAIRWRDTRDGQTPRGATIAYLAQGSVRSAALAMLAGVAHRIGFANSTARLLHTRRVSFHSDLHHAARLWQLASEPGDDALPLQIRPSLFPGASDVAAVDALLGAHRVEAAQPLIALAPGSVWATKRWPSYDALADALAADVRFHDHQLVVIGGANDRSLAQDIVARVAARGGLSAIDATGQLSLLASAQLIGRAQILITNDSLPLHLASAMNTPTVALFGPTVPAFGFGPLAERSVVAGVEGLVCRPCHAHGPQKCPLGHWKCMKELEVGRVVATIGEVLG